MLFLKNLSFTFTRKIPLILQTEATECGLACLGMIAGYHRCHVDIGSLRSRFSVSSKGSGLGSLINIAHSLKLATRPVKLDMGHLNQLRLPCILHWNFTHFVVLKCVGLKTAVIFDPAIGARTSSLAEVSNCFTGVALELWPDSGFLAQAPKPPTKLRDLIGNTDGFKRSFAQIVVLATALEVCALVAPFFTQLVIDNVIVSGDKELLATLALGFGLIALIQHCITAIRSWMLLYMGTTFGMQWRANLFSHLIRLPLQYFERRHIGDIVSRFSAIDQIQRTLTTSFVEGILDGAMSIVTLIMIFVYSPALAWVAVGAMFLYGIGRWILYGPLKNSTTEQIIYATKQQSHFLETIRGVKTIKLFQRSLERRATWIALLVNQVNAELSTQKLQILFRLLNGFLFGLQNIIIVWLGATAVLNGGFSIGVLIAVIAYKGQFEARVSSLIDKYFDVKMLQLQGDRLADIAMMPPEDNSGSNFSTSAQDVLLPTIEMRNLNFRYSDDEPYILKNITLRIDVGESVAIVGASGCGKSTLMSLMLGILPATTGEIFIGGLSIKESGTDSLRRLVGTVLQDDVLFAGSIADNISFFDSVPDRPWIQRCAELAAIASDVAAMPMSYSTLVGDMGTVLSGGQKQRVLLARALYKRPKILFLDEATSALDILKEREVNEAIKSLDITRIIIAHRPETIASADRVIVLADGKVVQDIVRSNKINKDADITEGTLDVGEKLKI